MAVAPPTPTRTTSSPTRSTLFAGERSRKAAVHLRRTQLFLRRTERFGGPPVPAESTGWGSLAGVRRTLSRRASLRPVDGVGRNLGGLGSQRPDCMAEVV